MKQKLSPEDRFMSKLSEGSFPTARGVTSATRCLNWTAKSKTGNGYGLFKLRGKYYQAHRIPFIFAGIDIPKGKEIDHICENRACVRMEHLRICTRSENLSASVKHQKQVTANGRKAGLSQVRKHKLPRFVYKATGSKNYFVRFTVDEPCKPKHFGCFSTVEEAKAARDQFRKELNLPKVED